MLAINWRPRAHLDRESIAMYLGIECAAPQAALKTIKAIDRAIARTQMLPDSGGHWSQKGLDGEFRTVSAGSYTVFYRYDEATLTVYRILHQRRDVDTYTLVEL
ncbi:type II toxin-antitoxin system RelE/ParE family toxin [Curtanaerobium respiraculi]|uniref:type II toxin-antitoxin system RelE/ParE family toxin n=1 Tax=Curtanaerobium respiraculi TaxID=2949669 RepID=UPI0024B3674C|nr:type II toxin-antitoxin system RelE/ParE family toxin [Curtanaerobium respiraculi]